MGEDIDSHRRTICERLLRNILGFCIGAFVLNKHVTWLGSRRSPKPLQYLIPSVGLNSR